MNSFVLKARSFQYKNNFVLILEAMQLYLFLYDKSRALVYEGGEKLFMFQSNSVNPDVIGFYN